MPGIIRKTLLNYMPKKSEIECEKIVKRERIYEVNNCPIRNGCILYLCEREVRAKDNFALQFSLYQSKEQNLPLKIIHPKVNYAYLPKQKFIDNQIKQTRNLFDSLNLDFEIIEKPPLEIIENIKLALLITDLNPILKRDYLNEVSCKVYEVDGHNIVPARFISDKQEYSAATLRRKIYYSICPFLTEFDNLTAEKTEADDVLNHFIKNRLPYYEGMKNDPSKDVLSGLSKYLNLGFISSQRVLLEVMKSDVSNNNKEAFWEELVVRKELSDNFCLYAKNFKDFSSVPKWAAVSLSVHKNDLRSYMYSVADLEYANTHDELWNAAQKQLISEGIIHGYLRMYWAKKILEWTVSPTEALNVSIYLNDKYAYDSPSANGYVGILWAIGGLHDRAFRDYPVTGKIRRMTKDSVKKKYKLNSYIEKYTK